MKSKSYVTMHPAQSSGLLAHEELSRAERHRKAQNSGKISGSSFVRSRWTAYAARCIFLLYGYFLIKVILFKFGSGDAGFLWNQLQYSLSHPGLVQDRMFSGNLEPFRQMKNDLRDGTSLGYANLFGNILIFIPFGFLMGMLTFKRNLPLLAGSLLCFLTSFALESAQLIFSIGQFDVDDMILNTSGGLAGLIMLLTIRWFVTSSKKV